MALNIEGASIGFDVNNVETALNNLNTRVIQDTINKMNSSMSTLREYVDNAWVGQSAEIFKENMETDKDTISKSLNDAFDCLKSEMYQIVNEMGEADAALMNRRAQ